MTTKHTNYYSQCKFKSKLLSNKAVNLTSRVICKQHCH